MSQNQVPEKFKLIQGKKVSVWKPNNKAGVEETITTFVSSIGTNGDAEGMLVLTDKGSRLTLYPKTIDQIIAQERP